MRRHFLAVMLLGAVSTIAGCDDKDKDKGKATSDAGSAVSTTTAADAGKTGAATTTSDGGGATAAAGDAGAPAAKPSMDELHKTLHKRLADANNGHDAKKVSALYADDAVVWMGTQKIATGRAAIEAAEAQQEKQTVDDKTTITRVFWKGNQAVMEWVNTGTTSADLPGNAKSKPYGVMGVSVITVNDDGLIKEEHLFQDSITTLSQMGMIPNMPARPIPAAPAGDTQVHESKGDAAEQKDVEVLDKLFAAEEAHKDADKTALLADDVVMWASWAPGNGEIKGKDQVKAMGASMDKAFPDGKETKEWAWATDGDYVVAQTKFVGHQKGELKFGANDKGIPAHPDKEVTLHGIAIYQIKDGKVVHAWDFGDGAEMMTQLGLMGPTAATASSGQHCQPGDPTCVEGRPAASGSAGGHGPAAPTMTAAPHPTTGAPTKQ